NDVPSFSKGADQAVNEDSGTPTGSHSVSGWATGISTGPANESGQSVDFIVTNNNSSLFSTQPAVSPSGDLSYTTAADANGVATVSVKIHDDGGTDHGGVDTSAVQTFTITVNAVNDAPVNAAPATAVVNEDAAVSFSNSPLTGLAVSDIDAGSSPVEITLSATNGTVTLGHPATFGISFVFGDGSNDATMVIDGSLAAINAA